MKAKVAVLKTRPETVLKDYRRLMKMAGVEQYLDKSRATILKTIFPGIFLTQGRIQHPGSLKGASWASWRAGFEEPVCVENKTVVTSAYKGEKLNKYIPVLKNIMSLSNTILNKKICSGLNISPGESAGPGAGFPGRDQASRLFLREKRCSPAHYQVPYIYTTTTGSMKNALECLLNTQAALLPQLYPPDAGGSSEVAEGNPYGNFYGYGRHHGGERPRPPHHDSGWKRTLSWPAGTVWRWMRWRANMMGFDPHENRLYPPCT